jgi:hypothetical protein
MKVPSEGATVKLDGWTPQVQPEEAAEVQVYREYVVDAVRMLYEVNKRETVSPFHPMPISLAMIYTAVRNRVEALVLQHKWQHFGYVTEHGRVVIRSKRYVDRRVNEAGSRQFGAKIHAVRAGFYLPAEEAEEWKKGIREAEGS